MWAKLALVPCPNHGPAMAQNSIEARLGPRWGPRWGMLGAMLYGPALGHQGPKNG